MQHCQKGMFGIINPPKSNVSNDLTNQATQTVEFDPTGTADVSQVKPTSGCSSVDCWVSDWTASVSFQ